MEANTATKMTIENARSQLKDDELEAPKFIDELEPDEALSYLRHKMIQQLKDPVEELKMHYNENYEMRNELRKERDALARQLKTSKDKIKKLDALTGDDDALLKLLSESAKYQAQSKKDRRKIGDLEDELTAMRQDLKARDDLLDRVQYERDARQTGLDNMNANGPTWQAVHTLQRKIRDLEGQVRKEKYARENIMINVKNQLKTDKRFDSISPDYEDVLAEVALLKGVLADANQKLTNKDKAAPDAGSAYDQGKRFSDDLRNTKKAKDTKWSTNSRLNMEAKVNAEKRIENQRNSALAQEIERMDNEMLTRSTSFAQTLNPLGAIDEKEHNEMTLFKQSELSEINGKTSAKAQASNKTASVAQKKLKSEENGKLASKAETMAPSKDLESHYDEEALADRLLIDELRDEFQENAAQAADAAERTLMLPESKEIIIKRQQRRQREKELAKQREYAEFKVRGRIEAEKARKLAAEESKRADTKQSNALNLVEREHKLQAAAESARLEQATSAKVSIKMRKDETLKNEIDEKQRASEQTHDLINELSMKQQQLDVLEKESTQLAMRRALKDMKSENLRQMGHRQEREAIEKENEAALYDKSIATRCRWPTRTRRSRRLWRGRRRRNNMHFRPVYFSAAKAAVT